MARPSQPPALAALGFGDELDELFRDASPNPTREGCPPHDVLVALSRRERSMDDPAWDHLLDCSPGYCEMRDMQRAHLLAAYERSTRRWLIGAAAAAAVLIVVVGAWLFAENRSVATGTEAPTTIQVTLDLGPYSVTRSPTGSAAPPPLELPRGVVELTWLRGTTASLFGQPETAGETTPPSCVGRDSSPLGDYPLPIEC